MSKRAKKWEKRRRKIAREKLGIELLDSSDWSTRDVWEYNRKRIKLKTIGIIPLDLSKKNIEKIFNLHF